jgi:hypothetical protein
MSKFSEYLKKPQSVTMDAVIAVCVGGAAYLIFSTFLGWLPLSDIIGPAVGGVVGAMTYTRARDNLLKPPPTFPE